MPFEKGVLVLEKGVLLLEKGVLLFEKGVLPFEKGVLLFENGFWYLKRELYTDSNIGVPWVRKYANYRTLPSLARPE